MRTLQVEAFGDPSALKVHDMPEREAGKGDVKIRVEGVGVGYFDGLLIKGEYQIKPPLPFVPGSALAGVVEAVGEGVTQLKVGDHVAGFALLGGLAEKAVLPANSCVPLPSSLPLVDAANFFVSYATGVLGLQTLANVQPNETVLILGASGSTGSTAIEIAKALGARVIACASTDEKRQRCKEAGADEVVDYTQDNWRKAVKALAPTGVDVVYDPVGGASAEPALRSMAPGGRYLVVGFVTGIASVPLNLPLLKRCSIMGVNWGAEVFANPAIVPPVMTQLVEWAQAGKLNTKPDVVYNLADAGKAFEALFGRTAQGKIVINPQA